MQHTYFTYYFCRFVEIQESNVNLKLTIVDTVGYGDQVNKTDRYCTYFYSIIRLLFSYCFHGQLIRKYLHIGTKSSGWLRYCNIVVRTEGHQSRWG